MILSDDIRNFLTGGVSITLASCNADLVPSLTRAKGCVVLAGSPTKLRVLVSAAHAGEFLDDVRATGVISATFSLPTTHRSLQFKGSDAALAPLGDGDREAIAKYVQAFAGSIGTLGFPPEFAAAFYASPTDEVAIEFTPSDAFQQTPGPAAGARLS